MASDLISKTYSTDNSKPEDEYYLQYLSENNLKNEDILESLIISDKDVATLITKLNNGKSSFYFNKSGNTENPEYEYKKFDHSMRTRDPFGS